jgi:predicted nucleic acid-binding protein
MTLAEVLVRSIRDGDPDIRSLYEMLFSQETRTIETHPVTLTTLVGAAELRARHPKLKLFDAIHLSTALQSRCSHFIKKDRELLRVVDAEGVQMSGPRSLPADEHDALSLRRALSR